MTEVILTLQLPRGNRFIPIAMCADLDVLRHFKHNVLALWERELELADDEIVAIVRRAEVEKLRRTLDLLIPDDITIARDGIINLLATPDNKSILNEIIELAEAEAEEYTRPDNQGD